MNQFTIRDIENLCGVKAHTLRIWEQRYNLFVPKRKESRHRVYDCDDLKELLRISFLYHHGYRISRIADMSPVQRQQEIAKVKTTQCSYELFVHQLVEASVVFDKEGFEKIVNALVLRIGLDKCIVNVFYPFLQRIGLLWMTNHVIPAQEHFSSHIIRKKLICAIDGLEPVSGRGENVVIFSPPGELHEIPLLVAQYFLRKKNINTTYFGTNVRIETLKYYADNFPVTHLYMHVITHLDNCGLDTIVKELSGAFPRQQLMISGPACACVQPASNVTRFHSIEEIDKLSRAISSN